MEKLLTEAQFHVPDLKSQGKEVIVVLDEDGVENCKGAKIVTEQDEIERWI